MRRMTKEEFVARMLSDIRAREEKEKEAERQKKHVLNGYFFERGIRFERHYWHNRRR